MGGHILVIAEQDHQDKATQRPPPHKAAAHRINLPNLLHPAIPALLLALIPQNHLNLPLQDNISPAAYFPTYPACKTYLVDSFVVGVKLWQVKTD